MATIDATGALTLPGMTAAGVGWVGTVQAMLRLGARFGPVLRVASWRDGVAPYGAVSWAEERGVAMATQISSADSYSLALSMTRTSDGAAQSLVGATITASAAGPGGATAAAVAIKTNAAAGEVLVPFDAGALSAVGDWEVQVAMLLSGERQTIARETVRVFAAV